MLGIVGNVAMAIASQKESGGVIINEHTLTRRETVEHIAALGKWFEFIHLDDLPRRLVSRGKKPFCLMTFDDGKRSNATVTAPELERLGVPAVFYVTTGFVESGQPLWFDRYVALRTILRSVPSGLEQATVKRLPLSMLEERLNRACDHHGITLNTDSDDVRPMSWDEIRGMVRKGFSIGAHGVRHAVLTREERSVALDEIAVSIGEVSTHAGVKCTTFAFPNGNYTAELARHAVRHGATTVMTTEPTWADATFPLWKLPRLQLFGESSQARIEAKICLATTGCVLKNPDGTGRAYRKVNRLSRGRTSGDETAGRAA